MSMIKSPEQISLMREAGRVVATTPAAVREAAGVGVALQDLDGNRVLVAGATPYREVAGARWRGKASLSVVVPVSTGQELLPPLGDDRQPIRR